MLFNLIRLIRPILLFSVPLRLCGCILLSTSRARTNTSLLPHPKARFQSKSHPQTIPFPHQKRHSRTNPVPKHPPTSPFVRAPVTAHPFIEACQFPHACINGLPWPGHEPGLVSPHDARMTRAARRSGAWASKTSPTAEGTAVPAIMAPGIRVTYVQYVPQTPGPSSSTRRMRPVPTDGSSSPLGVWGFQPHSSLLSQSAGRGRRVFEAGEGVPRSSSTTTPRSRRRWDKPPPLREEPKACVRNIDHAHARPTEAPHSATPGATSPLGRDVLTLLLKEVQASAHTSAHPPPLRRDQETSWRPYKRHAGDQPRALRNRILIQVAQASSLCVSAARSHPIAYCPFPIAPSSPTYTTNSPRPLSSSFSVALA